jgi:hypothetical protein
MNPRRGLALVMTVAALATVVTGAAAATAGASAKPTICVALVVDARSIGSDVSTSCAKVPKGATGIDVLEAGGHRVGFRSDGLLCTIDGLPKGGCADVNDTHYWAYFHRSPGATKWTYSSEGASTYQPVNDSTEGWVYDNGTALTPENVPYAQICKPTAKPTPTATATPTHVAHSPTPTPTPTPRPSKSPAGRHHSASPTARPTPTTRAVAATSPSLSPSPSTTSAALAGAVPPPSNHHGWLDLLIGLVVVAAIGISAAVRFRRARQ